MQLLLIIIIFVMLITVILRLSSSHWHDLYRFSTYSVRTGGVSASGLPATHSPGFSGLHSFGLLTLRGPLLLRLPQPCQLVITPPSLLS